MGQRSAGSGLVCRDPYRSAQSALSALGQSNCAARVMGAAKGGNVRTILRAHGQQGALPPVEKQFSININI